MKVSGYMLGWLEALSSGHVRKLTQIPAHTRRALERRRLVGRNLTTRLAFVTMHGDLVLAGARAEQERCRA